MRAESRDPPPGAYGLTSSDVHSAPRAFVTDHRAGLVVGGYVGVAAAVFVGIAIVTGSHAAAAYLTAIVVAAGSIVLVPLLVCVVCLGERAETAWLCRRFPKMRAVADYRRALEAAHRPDRDLPPAGLDWRSVDQIGLCEVVQRRLEDAGCTVVAVSDPAATGYDLEVRGEDGSLVLMRCVAGHRPADAATGRELLGAWTATGARRAVLVVPAGPTPALEELAARSPVTVANLTTMIEACIGAD